MPLCIKESDYNNLLRLLKEALQQVEIEIDQILTQKGSYKNFSKLPDLQNLQFELQILIHTLNEFPQFDEKNSAVMINISDINKDRLIGFLLSKVG